MSKVYEDFLKFKMNDTSSHRSPYNYFILEALDIFPYNYFRFEALDILCNDMEIWESIYST